MKKTHQPIVHTVSDDQAFEISIRHSEVRGLLYLLGMTLSKGVHGLTNDPDEQEQEGILCLVSKVGDDMGKALNAAFQNRSGKDAPHLGIAAQDSAHGVVTPLPQKEGAA